ncbi:MAG TPA: right-handed parallel beta-helix repeat-containing protein [Pseudonocardia sp.]|uniref:right-handed parallel beta-helix repeat-containing protein n=1 Tax=Pseudonocardia sp. TaxID=60912 RepID=UPI002B4B8549|nr:right-handed parallel beta-helix repeat-containing protein [Pseudonocardia sp.]HLU60512.1 right-handed parallel beta-helix repeat-containing protein [Pseudonocardia sp.]
MTATSRRRVPGWSLGLLAALALAFPPVAIVDTAPAAGQAADCSAERVVCMTGDTTSRIEVTTPGTVVDGRGFSSVGITVNADDVVVRNFAFRDCAGNCIWMKGERNVAQDNTVSQVYYAGDDIDGLRFFGDDTKILRNRFVDILKGPKHDSHLDCIQTWASPQTGGGSAHVVIAGNECRDPNFRQCVMVEGPGSTDGGGGGPGATRDWIIEDNHFECFANQTIALRDAHGFVIRNNTFAGRGNKAIQLADGTSGITIRDNVLGPGYRSLTGD